MKLLFLSSDRKIFDKESAVSSRMKKYASLVDTLTVIVFTKGSDEKRREIRENLTLIPTNSKSRWFYVFDAVRKGKELFRIDLVSAQDPFELGFTGVLLSRALKAKLEIQIHTDFLSPYFFREDSFLNRIRVFLARRVIPRADEVRVVSKRIVDSLQRENIQTKRNPQVLPVFIDLSKYRNISREKFLKEKYPQFDFHIFTASRLSVGKNLFVLLKAFSKIVEKYPKTGLILVGDGRERARLQNLAKKLGIEKSVVFEVWADDLGPYFLSADLFISVSFYEGFGLSLLEAASAGCPIVTTDVGIVGEILKPEHLFLSGFREGEIYSALLSAIEERKKREASGELLREDVLPFINLDSEEYFQKFVSSWKEIIEI